jgi:hypothetical protein
MTELPANSVLHIMMWNYRDDLPDAERLRLEAELETLPGKVPPLRSVRWGPVTGGRNQSFSHCFVMLFDDMQGVAEYATHPDHLHFSNPFREACAVQVVTDVQL